MLAAMLFDLDCTLVDRAESIRRYAARFVERFGACLATERLDRIEEVLIHADGWGYRPSTRFHDIAANLAWHAPPGIEEIAAHWGVHFPTMAVAMDGAIEMLTRLRAHGLALGVITNGSVRVQQTKIDILGIGPYFDAVIMSEAVGVKKPAPAIFHTALDSIGLRADQAWFVGDHPENDILGAHRAGLTTVWLAGPHAWPAAHAVPHHQISHLRELVPLVTSQMAE